MRCILCPAELDATTPPEHILSDAIGGRLMSREIVCATCNGALGRRIDKPISDTTRTLRYVLLIRSGSGDPPPSVTVPGPDGKDMTFHPDGRVFVGKGTLLEPVRSETRINVTANRVQTVEQAISLAAHGFRRAGIRTLEELDQRLLSVSATSIVEPYKDLLTVEVVIDGETLAQAAARASLEFLEYSQPGLALDARFDKARSYVKTGRKEHGDCTMWDAVNQPRLPFEAAELGEAFHSVVVWAHASAPVVGAVTLFGEVQFTTVLAEAWWGKAFAYAHAVDPLAGRSLQTRAFAPPPAASAASLQLRAYDRDRVIAGVGRLRALGDRRHADAAVARATARALPRIDEAWEQAGELDQAELAALVAKHATEAWAQERQGSSTKLDEDDLKRRVRARFAELLDRDNKK